MSPKALTLIHSTCDASSYFFLSRRFLSTRHSSGSLFACNDWCSTMMELLYMGRGGFEWCIWSTLKWSYTDKSCSFTLCCSTDVLFRRERRMSFCQTRVKRRPIFFEFSFVLNYLRFSNSNLLICLHSFQIYFYVLISIWVELINHSCEYPILYIKQRLEFPITRSIQWISIAFPKYLRYPAASFPN